MPINNNESRNLNELNILSSKRSGTVTPQDMLYNQQISLFSDEKEKENE